MLTETIRNLPRFRLFQSKLGWIGLDIGSASIKAVQLEQADGEVRIANTALIPHTAEELVSGDGVVRRALRKAVVRSGAFKGRDAAVSLPMSLTDLRSFNLPPVDEDELQTLLIQELEGPSEGEIEFDFWQNDSSARTSNGASQVSVLSIDSDRATVAASEFMDAGLQCQVMDGIHFAIARAVQLARPGDDSPMAAIDWGHSTGTFILVRNGRPIFTRLLRDCSYRKLADTGQRQLETTPIEFENMLQRHGCRHLLNLKSDDDDRAILTDDNEQVAVGQQLMQPLRHLVDELGRTLSYLRMQMADRYPQQLMLFGAGATIADLGPFLSEQLNFPCETWSLPRRRPNESHPDALFGAAAALSALAWER